MESLPVGSIFSKAATAVAQAVSMAGIGVVFKKAGVVDTTAQKVLSTISMKCMVPCLLFTSVITCPQDRSLAKGSCPDLLHMLIGAWPFLLLPFVWVTLGLLTGVFAAVTAGAPKFLRNTAIAACAFGNSTGLPITLLTAISQAGITTAEPSQALRNFLVLLSIYQITYPMLQWSIAGSLLQKVTEDDQKVALIGDPEGQVLELPYKAPGVEGEEDLKGAGLVRQGSGDSASSAGGVEEQCSARCLRKLSEALQACLVPPVIAVLAGVAIGLCPALREVLVDTRDFDNDSYLEFAFNAIESFGKAAVPLNMLILGASLANVPKLSAIHWPTTLAVAFGKLVVCPTIALLLVTSVDRAGLMPDLGAGGFKRDETILVALIVTCTPTANNLAVLAEMSGGPQCKQALAAMVFLMYCLAPFMLTGWIVAFVALGQ